MADVTFVVAFSFVAVADDNSFSHIEFGMIFLLLQWFLAV